MKKSFLGLGILTLAFAGAAMATPVNQCDGSANNTPGGPLGGKSQAPINTALIDGVTNSCAVNGLIFSNFQVSVAGGSGAPEVDLVSVTISGAQVLLNFNPNMGSGNANNITDLHFSFNVGGGMIGASVSESGTGSGIGECIGSGGDNNGCTGTTYFSWSIGDNSGATCVGNATTNTFGTTVGGTPACNFGTGVTGGHVFKDIQISSTLAHLTSFTEGFITPEPMTMSLMGIGLLGLGLAGRRLRK
jgi:hypothetical protein